VRLRLKRKPEPFWEKGAGEGPEDILRGLAGFKGSTLFLGRYSVREVVAVLEKRNFFKEAARRGFLPLEYELDSSAYPLQRLQIFAGTKSPEAIIVDLKIRETEFLPPALEPPIPGLPSIPPLRALALEWLTLQNPLAGFNERRPALPGQAHPGLKLGHKVLDIFVYLARLLHKDALLAFPAYFHNALLFSRYFRFFNPRKEAEVMAIRHAFLHIPFKNLAWAVHLGCLRRSDGSVYAWTSEVQVYPLNRALRAYFDSRAYRDTVKGLIRPEGFAIDWEAFERKQAQIPSLYGPGPGLV
jgi:hypothetical protein